jgi:MFS family permease
MSRFWCIVAASSVFCAAQLCAILIEDPAHLWAVSGLTGLAYGFLFGVYPTMISEAFGVHGLSQNWGTMTLAPVVSGNAFNLIYGKLIPLHS